MKQSKPIITVCQLYEYSIECVWLALTKHQQMIQWYFKNIPHFKAEVGFSTQFVVENNGQHFIHLWQVVEVKHLKSITYNWNYQGYKGNAQVTFNLSKIDEKTHLQVNFIVLEDFPNDIPEFTTKSCQAGWDYLIKQALKFFLEKSYS